MKIIKLKAENVKRLQAVEITPDPESGTVIIAGRNGQGKTSVLDSIWLALGGGAAGKESGTVRTIRDGEHEAIAELTISGDPDPAITGGHGELIVQRTWTKRADGSERTSLRVTSGDGRGYTSPQRMLDGLVGRLSFDPLAFSQQPEKQQLTTLLGMLDLDIDLDAVAERRRTLYDQRTIIGREAKRKRAEADAMPPPSSTTPDEEVSARELLGRLNEARELVSKIQSLKSWIGRWTQEIEELQQKISVANDELFGLSDPPNVEQMAREMETLEERNQKVRDKQRWLSARAAARAMEEQRDALSWEIAELDREKEQALADAALPIEGLGFTDDGVTFNGVPLKQCSSAEQLKVSIAIAMAANPQLRVIRITDGSLLDASNLALVDEMAASGDYQIWLERVDDTGSVGIVIEDGLVAERDAVEERGSGGE